MLYHPEHGGSQLAYYFALRVHQRREPLHVGTQNRDRLSMGFRRLKCFRELVLVCFKALLVKLYPCL